MATDFSQHFIGCNTVTATLHNSTLKEKKTDSNIFKVL